MDSFCVFFGQRLSVTGLKVDLQGIAQLTVEEVGSIIAERGISHIWITIYGVDELDEVGFEHEDEWPIVRAEIGCVLSILVGRQSGSTELALIVAHELARKYDGRIKWYGMTDWERSYNAQFFQ